MTDIVEHINLQTLLQLSAASRASFGLQLFLVDDAQIPADTRLRLVTRSGYKTDLTPDTVPYNYADVFFGGSLKPAQLMLGRWAAAALAPRWIAGPALVQVVASWAAISTGSIKIVDDTLPTPLTDSVTAIDFSAITAIAQIATVLQAKLQAIVTPNIVGLNTATVSFDALGRLQIVMPTAGSARASIHVADASTGVSLLVLLDASHGHSVAGIDAESLVDAVSAVKAINNTFYNIHERGGSDAQKLALSAWVETEVKQYDAVISALTAKDPLVTNDFGSQVKALSRKQTFAIYSEKDGTPSGGGYPDYAAEYPDAAAAAEFLTAIPGTKQWEWTALSNVTDSGRPLPLSATDRAALKAKRYSYIEDIDGTKILYPGLSAAGIEKRIMLGKHWFDATNQSDLFNYQVGQNLAAFDNVTMVAIEGIYRRNLGEAVRRRIILDTKLYPVVVTIPDADDISQTERDTREMVRTEVYWAKLNTAIHDYNLVGVWEQ